MKFWERIKERWNKLTEKKQEAPAPEKEVATPTLSAMRKLMRRQSRRGRDGRARLYHRACGNVCGGLSRREYAKAYDQGKIK